MKAIIFCCECNKEVASVQITGQLVYTHRKDLKKTLFYQCPVCKNFVGTHKDTGKPVGCIANQELKNARKHIHDLIDPLFKKSHISRQDLYSMIAKRLNIPEYHTADIKSIAEAKTVYRVCMGIANELKGGSGK